MFYMKAKYFFLFLLKFLLLTNISSAQDEVITKDTFQTESDSLSAKWFKKHEFSYSKIILPEFAFSYNHNFDYRYNLGRNAIRISATFYKFEENRFLDVYFKLNSNQEKTIQGRTFDVKSNIVMAGYELRNRFMNRFCFFYGLQGGFRWSDEKIISNITIKTSDQNHVVETEYIKENIIAKEKAIVISPFTGLRLELLKNLAIGTDLALDMNFSRLSGEKIIERPAGSERENITFYTSWIDNPGTLFWRYFIMIKL